MYVGLPPKEHVFLEEGCHLGVRLSPLALVDHHLVEGLSQEDVCEPEHPVPERILANELYETPVLEHVQEQIHGVAVVVVKDEDLPQQP